MHEHQLFMKEKESIDDLVDQGYKIIGIKEDLSGAHVHFDYIDHDNRSVKTKVLHVLSADARKYFTTLLFAKEKRFN
ncbi:hypothetical protein [Terrilactibacillus laevilacticus]|nr:hypothetical protein [Terrilactibacillus laevilacticus]